jgi:ribosomal protein S12 methylthiotransferase
MKKVKGTLALVSLGCAKNAVDLQVTAGNLLKSGWELSPDPDRADVCIINTCSFIASAREEAEYEILRALELKRRGQYGKVVVSGCYPERYPQAYARFPGVDEWRGVPKSWEDPPVPALRFTGKAFAYLKIAEGCAHRCAYCAIPGIRGKYTSRPPESIIAQAQALLASGCRELNIIAQDPMLYGIDFKGRKSDRIGLSDLLWALDELPGDFWVRVLYSYPSEITGDFIDWMNNSRHAVKYIDVPLRHTVPEVLVRMNRKAAVDMSVAAADVLRELVDGVTLRTTIMTGFPGETERRFCRMKADLKRMQFDHLGAFAFSPEKGTASFSMSSRPSRAVAERREREIMELAAEIHDVKAQRMLGGKYQALVVAPGVARLQSQAPDVDGVVHIKGGEAGEFVNVKLIKAEGFDFKGKIV